MTGLPLNALTFREVLEELGDEFVVRARQLRTGAERLDDHGAAALRGRARGYEESSQAIRSLLTHNRVPHWEGGFPPSLQTRSVAGTAPSEA